MLREHKRAIGGEWSLKYPLGSPAKAATEWEPTEAELAETTPEDSAEQLVRVLRSEHPDVEFWVSFGL